jgi:hypothetical protein
MKAGAAQEGFERGTCLFAAWFLARARLLQEIGDKPRQALVLARGRDPRASRDIVRQSYGDVAHDTDIVFSCFRVKLP